MGECNSRKPSLFRKKLFSFGISEQIPQSLCCCSFRTMNEEQLPQASETTKGLYRLFKGKDSCLCLEEVGRERRRRTSDSLLRRTKAVVQLSVKRHVPPWGSYLAWYGKTSKIPFVGKMTQPDPVNKQENGRTRSIDGVFFTPSQQRKWLWKKGKNFGSRMCRWFQQEWLGFFDHRIDFCNEMGYASSELGRTCL